MGTSFAMDNIGFLQAVNQLERRFDEVVSPDSAAASTDAADDNADSLAADGGPSNGGPSSNATRGDASSSDTRDPLDPRLYELARDIFGNTAWTLTICLASISYDTQLIGVCRDFMHGCAAIVRKYGLSVWLYDLINDSAMAVFTSEPSARMPICIRMRHHVDMMRRFHMHGINRYGTREQREADIWEYSRQMHRLGAYSLLRWGAGERQSEPIALALLTDPGVGMCMLREDSTVMGMGAAPDMRYRRIVDYLKELRAQADLDYARTVGSDGIIETLPNRVPGFADIDARYIGDAARLIRAYRDLWNVHVERADDVMADIERDRALPRVPLWVNVVHLRDLAYSLMGATLSADLVQGFEDHDAARFEEGVQRLEHMAKAVREHGLVMLPGLLLEEHEPASSQSDNFRLDEWETAQRAYSRMGEDMAAVMLYRIPDEDLARRCALSLVNCDTDGYAEVIKPLLSGEYAARCEADLERCEVSV